MDPVAIEKAVDGAIRSIRAMDYEPYRGFKDVWPGGTCEWTSIGIAEVLRVRGLGEWTFVQASRPGEINGHAWLELRDDEGTALFSVDATLDQFGHHASPYVGPGRTPAAAEFTEVNYEGPWRDWGVISHNPTFVRFAEATLLHSGGPSGPDIKQT